MAMPSRRGDGWPVSVPWPTKSNLLTVSKCRSAEALADNGLSAQIRTNAPSRCAAQADFRRGSTATRPERPLMGRPDRCSARRGGSAQRRRVSANDLLVDEPTAGRARAVRARGRMRRARHRDEDEEEAQDDGPQREPVGPGADALGGRRAGGGGRSATSRGSDGAPTVRPVISTVRRRDGAASARCGASGARRDGPWSSPREKRAAALGPRRARSAACAAWRSALVDDASGSSAWRSGRRHGARPPRGPQRARRDAGRDGPPSRACARAVRAGTARRPTTHGCRAGACRCSRPLSGAYGVS